MDSSGTFLITIFKIGWLIYFLIAIKPINGESRAYNWSSLSIDATTGVLAIPTDSLDPGDLSCLLDTDTCTAGFTIAFSLLPSALTSPVGTSDWKLNPKYWATNGGHLPYYRGFFMRQTGSFSFEIGVTSTSIQSLDVKDSLAWLVSFNAQGPGWMGVVATWSDRTGLEVWIDGLSMVQGKGTPRVEVFRRYPLFSSLQFDLPWTGENGNNIPTRVKDVSFYNYINPLQGYIVPLLGCSSNYPNSTILLPIFVGNVDSCITRCRRNLYQVVVRVGFSQPPLMGTPATSSAQCRCLANINETPVTTDVSLCKTQTDWYFFLASHASNPMTYTQKINLNYFILNTKGSINTELNSESVLNVYTDDIIRFTFNITSISPSGVVTIVQQIVVVNVYFGNNDINWYSGTAFEYRWIFDGKFNMTINATTSYGTAFQSISVDVKPSTSRPKPLGQLIFDAWYNKDNHSIQMSGYVVSENGVTNCSVFDDNKTSLYSISNINKPTLLIQPNYTLPIHNYGVFSYNSTCTKDEAKTSVIETVIVPDDRTLQKNNPKYSDLQLNIADLHLNPSQYKVRINGASITEFSVAGSTLTIPKSVLPEGLINFIITILLSDSSINLRTWYIVLQDTPSISITSDRQFGSPGTVFHINCTLNGSGSFQVLIDNGNKGKEFFMLNEVNGAISFLRNFTYVEIDVYKVKFVVTDGSNVYSSEMTVGAQIEIVSARIDVQGGGVSSTHEPAVLLFYLNEKKDKPVRNCNAVLTDLSTNMIYNTTLPILQNQTSFGPFPVQLKISTYGIHMISVVLWNEIGQITTNTSINVGEPIALFKVQSTQYLVTADSNAVFNILIIGGSPTKITIISDQGPTWIIPELGLTNSTQESTLTLYGEAVSKQIMTLSFEETRVFSSNVGSLTLGRKNTPMLLSLNMPKVGIHYLTFKAENPFSTTNVVTLCQPIIVHTLDTTRSNCNFGIQINSITNSITTPLNRASTLTVTVSSPIQLSVNIISSCLTAVNVRVEWNITSIDSQDAWPYSPCIPTGVKMIQPSRSLLDGNYIIHSTAFQLSNYKNYRTIAIPLKIVKSPLNAILNHGKDLLNVTVVDEVELNLKGSGDPDNILMQETIIYKLFCFVAKDRSMLPLTEISLNKLSPDFKQIAVNTSMFINKTNAGIPSVTLFDYKNECFTGNTNSFRLSIIGGVDVAVLRFVGVTAIVNTPLVIRLSVMNTSGKTAVTEMQLWVSPQGITESSIDKYILDGDSNSAIHLINMAISNNRGTLSNKTATVDTVAEALQKVSNAGIDSLEFLNQLGSSIESVTSDTKLISANSKIILANTINTVALFARNFSNNSMEMMTTTSTSILTSVSNVIPTQSKADFLIEAAALLRDQLALQIDQQNETDPSALLEDPGQFEIADVPEELLKFYNMDEVTEIMRSMHPDDIKDLVIQLQNKMALVIREANAVDAKVSTACMEAVSSIGGALSNKGNVTVTTSNLEMQMSSPPESGPASVESTVGSSLLPENLVNNTGGGIMMVGMAKSPFTWGSIPVASPTVSLEIKTNTGDVVPVDNSSELISLFISRKVIPTPVLYVLYTKLATEDSPQSKPIINYHSVNLTRNGTILSTVVRPLSTIDRFVVYIGLNYFPNETHYDYLQVIPQNSIDDSTEQSPLEDEFNYTFRPPANITAFNGTYHIGVGLKSTYYDTLVADRQFNYTFVTYISSCLFFNKTLDDWDNSGVKVGPLTSLNSTQCLASHLTSFGDDFIVPPNTIDFNTVWAKFNNLSENAAVFATVITVILLYLLGLIWARFKDKKDERRWEAKHLVDNLPTDTYNYHLSVMTGLRAQAGTTSHVGLVLCGDEGDTGIRQLADGKRKEFQRGSALNFVLSVEQSLGPLTFLRIWHDNTGSGKNRSWFLDQVVVTDVQTGDKYFFLCNQWLAVEEGDGQVERLVPVAGYSDLISFKHLFSNSVTQKLRNDHLWISVFSRPTRSTFTRAQRISCCLSLLFLTMITNAMFFKSADNMETRTGITLGPITFTLDQLFISVVSTLIVFPPSILMVTFFRKCRIRSNKIQQDTSEMTSRSKQYSWKAMDPTSDLIQPKQPAHSLDIDVQDASLGSRSRFMASLRAIISSQPNKKEAANQIPGSNLPLPPKKKQAFLFPFWCIYIAWALVFFSVFGSAFFVILYSMEWGAEKANDWLITFVLSFFQSILVVQPIKVLLLAAFISLILKKPELDEEQDILDDKLFNNTETKTDVDINSIIIQRQSGNSSIAPPDEKKLAAIRAQRLQEIQMEAILKEIATYAIFILVIFFISYQTRSSLSYSVMNNMQNTFTNKFVGQINTYADLFAYVNTTLIPNMWAPSYYNGRKLTWREALAINDGNYQTNRIGVARLRQFRIKDDTCNVVRQFQNLISFCRDEYSWTADDTKAYLPFWQISTNFTSNTAALEADYYSDTEPELSGLNGNSPFVYQSSWKLKGLPYLATLNLYKGGGYVFIFNRSQAATQVRFNKIFQENWLDSRTRAVFIEFTVYNVASNLFSTVTMVVEFMTTGGATTRADIKVFRLFNYVGSFGTIVILMEVVFLLFVVYFIIREVNQFRVMRFKYFKDFWCQLEFATLSVAVAGVVMYAFKKILTSAAMDALSNSGSADFVNFASLATYDELYVYMIGILVFIGTIKFIKILKFNKRIGMLGATIKLAAGDLRGFTLMFWIYFMAFCTCAYLLFSVHLQGYSTFVGTVESLLSMALGSFDFYAIETSQPLLGPIFFVLFINVITMGLLGMLITIINEAFETVKSNTDLQSNDYELVDFMWRRLTNAFGCSSMHQAVGDGEVDEEDEEEEEVNKMDQVTPI